MNKELLDGLCRDIRKRYNVSDKDLSVIALPLPPTTLAATVVINPSLFRAALLLKKLETIQMRAWTRYSKVDAGSYAATEQEMQARMSINEMEAHISLLRVVVFQELFPDRLNANIATFLGFDVALYQGNMLQLSWPDTEEYEEGDAEGDEDGVELGFSVGGLPRPDDYLN
jgi:hypothetical protein